MAASDPSKSLGIHLGNSYWRFAAQENGFPFLLQSNWGKTEIPFYFAINDKEYLFGEDAISQSAIAPSSAVFDMIRLTAASPELARDLLVPFKISEKNGQLNVELDDGTGRRSIAVDDVIKRFFRLIAKTLVFPDEAIKGLISAVVSVPISFSETHKAMVQEAGKRAGFRDMTVVNRSLAAFIGFARERMISSGKYIAVYLGSACLQLSLFEFEGNMLKTVTQSQYNNVGGADFDWQIFLHCQKVFHAQHKLDLAQDSQAIQRLRVRCEKAKRDLSSAKVTIIRLPNLIDNLELVCKITRQEFEDICRQKIEEVNLYLCNQVRRIDVSNVDEVVMLGGTSRIPALQSLIKEQVFPNLRINHAIRTYADLASTYGASAISACPAALRSDDSVNWAILTGALSSKVLVQQENKDPMRGDSPDVNKTTMASDDFGVLQDKVRFFSQDPVNFRGLKNVTDNTNARNNQFTHQAEVHTAHALVNEYNALESVHQGAFRSAPLLSMRNKSKLPIQETPERHDPELRSKIPTQLRKASPGGTLRPAPAVPLKSEPGISTERGLDRVHLEPRSQVVNQLQNELSDSPTRTASAVSLKIRSSIPAERVECPNRESVSYQQGSVALSELEEEEFSANIVGSYIGSEPVMDRFYGRIRILCCRPEKLFRCLSIIKENQNEELVHRLVRERMVEMKTSKRFHIRYHSRQPSEQGAVVWQFLEINFDLMTDATRFDTKIKEIVEKIKYLKTSSNESSASMDIVTIDDKCDSLADSNISHQLDTGNNPLSKSNPRRATDNSNRTERRDHQEKHAVGSKKKRDFWANLCGRAEYD